MATEKEINHDSSTTLSDFYSTITDIDNAITVIPGAALGSSINGVAIDYDAGANIGFLSEPAVLSGNEMRWRFRLKRNTIAAASSILMARFVLEAVAPDTDNFNVDLYVDSSGISIEVIAIDDAGTNEQAGVRTLLSGSDESCIEVRAVRETADGNNDGILEFFINGISQGSRSDIENFNRWVLNGGVGQMSIGIFSTPAGITGELYYDEWILDDTESTNLCMLAANLSLAPMTKPADLSEDGTSIYVALLNGGTPILTKISTTLTSDGTTVFDPGAGDNIGVECGRFSSDTVWVAGNFDGTNVVEKSEDAGDTFTVKDDATIGDVRSFVMGPDSDERILLFDETNGDILESIDDGDTWTNINSSVTPEVNAIGRLGENVQESVFGNDGGANNSINYSVNSGDDLEDFQTGVYPNADATGVIVN